MVIGRVYFLQSFVHKIAYRSIQKRDIDSEIARFNRAVARSRSHMKDALERTRLSADIEAIFEAQYTILEDPALIGESQERIRTRCINAEWALESALAILKEFLLKTGDPVFQEKADDLEDVGRRILDQLLCENEAEKLTNIIQKHRGPLILASDKIVPSVFLHIPLEKVDGLLARQGGITGHMAIIAKSHNLPALVQVDKLREEIHHGDTVLLDCIEGQVTVHPGLREQTRYQRYLLERSHKDALSIHSPVASKDDLPVEIWINLEDIERTSDERMQDMSGVGLFRTEFLYMRDKRLFLLPEEHNAVYKRILKNLKKNLKDKPVQFRLLDISQDKPLPRSVPAHSRELKGLRFLLANPELLGAQLEGIILAASQCSYHDGQCRVVLPMVNNVEEILIVKEHIAIICKSLESKSLQRIPHIALGIMIESPAAVQMAGVLSKHADFFCIGSNDLARLNLAVERNSKASSEELLYHPALYHQIKSLTENCALPLLLCGAIGSQSQCLPLLVALGLRRISIPISAIVDCSLTIRDMYCQRWRDLAKEALSLQSVSELSAFLAMQHKKPHLQF